MMTTPDMHNTSLSPAQLNLAQVMAHPTEVRFIQAPAGTYVFANTTDGYSRRVRLASEPREATIKALVNKGVLAPITYTKRTPEGREFTNTVYVYAASFGLPTFICDIEQAWDAALTEYAERSTTVRYMTPLVELPAAPTAEELIAAYDVVIADLEGDVGNHIIALLQSAREDYQRQIATRPQQIQLPPQERTICKNSLTDFS